VAITAARTTGDFAGFLRPDQAAPIFDQAARVSVVQQLARRVPLGANGVEIPVVTGKMTAGWVGEAGQKPASQGAVGLKTITPKKVAAIAVVSAEVVRADPAGYMGTIRPQIAEAFGLAFDNAALHDFGPDGTAGAGPFATWIDQTTKSVEIGTTAQASGGIHGDLVAGMSLLVNAGKRLTGFALDDTVEPLLWGAVDTTGRPLYTELATDDTSGTFARPGRLLNRPSYMGPGLTTPIITGTPNTGGIRAYGGDWTQAVWGVVGGITYDVSTQATVTINGVLTSLWENNLVAIRAEAEYGFLVNDTAAFVKYTNNT
jgi:HK97 family phage major capsid protein